MKDYREKIVSGMVSDITKTSMTECPVYVRMTKDKRGASLSLQAYNIMVMIPLEPVADIIKVAEKGE